MTNTKPMESEVKTNKRVSLMAATQFGEKQRFPIITIILSVITTVFGWEMKEERVTVHILIQKRGMRIL